VRAEEIFSLIEGEEESSDCWSSEDAGVRRSVYWARRAASSLRMRSSSSVTRFWIWSSRLRWRVESVFFDWCSCQNVSHLESVSQYLGAVL
jgi:hypothetical protein